MTLGDALKAPYFWFKGENYLFHNGMFVANMWYTLNFLDFESRSFQFWITDHERIYGKKLANELMNKGASIPMRRPTLYCKLGTSVWIHTLNEIECIKKQTFLS